MITATQFIVEAGRQGFDFYTGVPCSFLTPLINGVLNDRSLTYVGATSEGEAVAIAAGAWLAGRQTVVMCQNSGLGNAVNPLTSLNAPFQIPTLFVTTWRGQPGLPDEPQHAVMGTITQDLLALIGIEQAPFPREEKDLAPALAKAANHLRARELPYALVMENGSVKDEALLPTARPVVRGGLSVDDPTEGPLPSRIAVLEAFLDVADDQTAVIATTGKCGRELFTLADREQHLYQVGSMGGASAMGLGIALNTKKTVVVFDGDGALLEAARFHGRTGHSLSVGEFRGNRGRLRLSICRTLLLPGRLSQSAARCAASCQTGPASCPHQPRLAETVGSPDGRTGRSGETF